MIEVKFSRSSFLEKVAYNKEKKELTVTMKSGKRYRYKEVPTRRFNSFVDSESRGSFFSHKIRGQFKVRKLKQVCLQ